MRLIDADELKRYIDDCDFCARCSDASPRCQIDCEMPDFLTKRWEGVIDAQPTAEAIPVEYIESTMNRWKEIIGYEESVEALRILIDKWKIERKEE